MYNHFESSGCYLLYIMLVKVRLNIILASPLLPAFDFLMKNTTAEFENEHDRIVISFVNINYKNYH